MSPRSRPGNSRGAAGRLFLLLLVAAVLAGGWLWLGYLLWVERTPAAERTRAALLASEQR